MNDPMTTIRLDDSPALRALRYDLADLQHRAARIEARAAERQAREPAPVTPGDAARARNRAYQATFRAGAYRRRAARVIAAINAAELAAAAAELI